MANNITINSSGELEIPKELGRLFSENQIKTQTHNGTCTGSNSACTNDECAGSSNGTCDNSFCYSMIQ